MFKKGLFFTMCMFMIFSVLSFSNEKTTFPKGIKNVISITEPSGSGELFTAIAIEYDKNVLDSSLTLDSYKVDGRKVVGIYTNTNAETKRTRDIKNGKYVILELEKELDKSMLRVIGSGRAAGFTFSIKEPDAKIVQVKEIKFISGKKFNAQNVEITNNKVRRMIVEDFKQFEYVDEATGIKVKYNLYIPKNYDKNKKYPLVMFIHDASVTSAETTATLRQGNGATIWATPFEQQKNEAFVLAPQFDHTIANDKSDSPADLDPTINLIKSLMKEYSIDEKRLYATGQSGGGMMSIAMNIKYPDFFAASYLVACQWDYTLVKPMSKNNIWITVSTGDLKAYPGMNAITTVFEQNGANIAKATFKGDYSYSQFENGVKELLNNNPNSNIKYTTIEKGTISGVTAEKNLGGAAEHTYTWRIAYNIEGIRNWLFSQRKL